MNKTKNKSIYSSIYNILNNREFLKESRLVYHYTSLEALHKILTSRCFHFTHCAFMNDYSEFEFGINSFQEKMREYIQDSEDQIAIDKLDLIKNVKRSGKVFIGSFTSLRDSISQWRLYASNATGVAIGLNVAQLDDFCNKNELLFGSIVYSNDFDKLFAQFVKTIMPLASHVMDNQTTSKIRSFNTIIFGYLLTMTCFMKHIGFKEEYEIRVVAGSGTKVKNKLHKGLYIPYCEIDFDGSLLELIDEIWIGPASNQELAKRSVQLMLEENELEGKCSIELSQIPFRLLSE